MECPAHAFVLVGAQSRPEVKAAPGQVIQHGGFFGQAHGVMQGKLVNHSADSDDAGVLSHGGQIHAGCSDLAHMGVLMFDDEIGV